MSEIIDKITPVFPYIIIGVFVIYVFFYILRIIFLLYFKKYRQTINPRQASNKQPKKRFLILGDSLAVGIGADRFEDTIEGRFIKDFPEAEILNLGKDNSLVKDLTDQIKDIIDQKFDLIIISAGTNDIWHFTKQITFLKHLEFVLEAAKIMSNNHLLFLINNNIEEAPLLRGPVRHFLKKRFQIVEQTLNLICYQKEVSTIDFYAKPEHSSLLRKQEKLFSTDGVHPSSSAYGLWYKRMWILLANKGLTDNH